MSKIFPVVKLEGSVLRHRDEESVRKGGPQRARDGFGAIADYRREQERSDEPVMVWVGGAAFTAEDAETVRLLVGYEDVSRGGHQVLIRC
ncbi:hypothetical protein MK139_16935 [bacterium]|nr:hypothetical protein [bacterium]